MKKIATPLEVAYQVLVMSSDVLSGHTTGQIVMVAGGMEGRSSPISFLILSSRCGDRKQQADDGRRLAVLPFF
jgi:hypothetical protein